MKPKAVSPYAPNRAHNPASSARATAAIAILLFVIRYWTSRTKSETETNKLYRLWECFVQSGPGSAMLERIRASRCLVGSIRSAIVGSSTTTTTTRTCGGNSSNLDEIRNNKADIQSVLKYWFGQHTPEKSQKKLWMIAASSKEHRGRVDAEMACRFENLLKDLSWSGDGVRDDNKDAQVYSRRWQQWCLDPDGIYGSHGKIAAIIVLDQFSRHILRHYHENNTTLPQQQQQQQQQNLPTKESLDRLALTTAERLVQDHKAELDCGMIPLPMRVFALMPYRHAGTMESVKYVQQTVEEMATLEEQNEAMVGRFRKATNRRLAVLQDEQRRNGTQRADNSRSDGKGNDAVNGPTGAQKQFSDDEILETFPFDADMTPSLKHPIHKTMVDFLEAQGIYSSNSKTPSPQKAGIIVSLSGGVDSMVIANVLAHLKANCGYEHLTILAAHIDYANRPESGAEANYVRRYCEDQLEGRIDFTCRRIGEVTRGVTARDDYERIAREIRYTSYHEAVAKAKDMMGLVSKEDRSKTIVGVMLGHHRGDLRENVLSNAHKGCGPLDLSGMTAVSKNDGITLYRPLLPLEKSFVFDYAHKFGVPYYKDTTPHWSTRGKLRNKLLPLLEEIYGDGSMNNLSNLAVESDECRALMNKSMIEPFLASIVRKPMGIYFDTHRWKDQPLFFWKVVLREALHSVGLGMFSDKSVTAFLERARKPKTAWLQCRKDYGVYLREDGMVFVLYRSSFPWSKKDAYRLDGQVLHFGTKREVGPWVVHTEIIPKVMGEDSSQSNEVLLAKKAVGSMEDFMDGTVEYYVEAPIYQNNGSVAKPFLPKPLVFRTFSKTDRPKAWKNCDLRIQSTLPVLGIDESSNGTKSNHEENTDTTHCLIKVSMTLGKSSDGE